FVAIEVATVPGEPEKRIRSTSGRIGEMHEDFQMWQITSLDERAHASIARRAMQVDPPLHIQQSAPSPDMTYIVSSQSAVGPCKVSLASPVTSRAEFKRS